MWAHLRGAWHVGTAGLAVRLKTNADLLILVPSAPRPRLGTTRRRTAFCCSSTPWRVFTRRSCSPGCPERSSLASHGRWCRESPYDRAGRQWRERRRCIPRRRGRGDSDGSVLRAGGRRDHCTHGCERLRRGESLLGFTAVALGRERVYGRTTRGRRGQRGRQPRAGAVLWDVRRGGYDGGDRDGPRNHLGVFCSAEKA